MRRTQRSRAAAIGAVALFLASLAGGCSNATPSGSFGKAVGRDRLASLTTLTHPSYGIPGISIYSLKYWSRGHLIQAYLDVPSGKGPFPLLVVLHGGWQDALPLRHVTHAEGVLTSFTLSIAAQWAPYKAIVLLPNYAGYGPSEGTVSTPPQNAIDTLNGISALGQICGLRLQRSDTYLLAYSMGGAVAVYMAEREKGIRTAVMLSPGLNRFWNQKNFQIHIPVLMLAGTQDPVLPPDIEEVSYNVLRRHDTKRVAFMLEPGGHVPLTASWQDMIDWFSNYGLSLGLYSERGAAPQLKMCPSAQ